MTLLVILLLLLLLSLKSDALAIIVGLIAFMLWICRLECVHWLTVCSESKEPFLHIKDHHNLGWMRFHERKAGFYHGVSNCFLLLSFLSYQTALPINTYGKAVIYIPHEPDISPNSGAFKIIYSSEVAHFMWVSRGNKTNLNSTVIQHSLARILHILQLIHIRDKLERFFAISLPLLWPGSKLR